MGAAHWLVSLATVVVAAVGGCARSESPGHAEATPKQVVRYLALGDSLSEGNGAADPLTGSFPARLTAKWTASGCDVELRNAAVSGFTAAQVLSNEVPSIDEFAPTVITFQTGGNDIARGVPVDEFRASVREVLDAAERSAARVYVLTQPERHRSPKARPDPANKRAAFDEVLIEEVGHRNAELVDLRTLFAKQADENMWAADGLHPSGEAYEQWATELAEVLPSPCV